LIRLVVDSGDIGSQRGRTHLFNATFLTGPPLSRGVFRSAFRTATRPALPRLSGYDQVAKPSAVGIAPRCAVHAITRASPSPTSLSGVGANGMLATVFKLAEP